MLNEVVISYLCDKYQITSKGLPLGKLTALYTGEKHYKIVPLHTLEERYNRELNTLCRTKYAVFDCEEQKVISIWYKQYHNAVKKLLSLGNHNDNTFK